MAHAGERIGNPASGFSLLFLKAAADTDGELLEMEATYEPGSVRPVEHFHPRQSEHFEILEGSLHARIGGKERELRAGETLEIEPGVPHAMWNEGPGRARTTWQTRPALRTESFFETTMRFAAGGKPGRLQIAVIASTYRDEFRATSPPQAVQAFALAILAPIGRLLGRRA